jgi:hypothetical protein
VARLGVVAEQDPGQGPGSGSILCPVLRWVYDRVNASLAWPILSLTFLVFDRCIGSKSRTCDARHEREFVARWPGLRAG